MQKPKPILYPYSFLPALEGVLKDNQWMQGSNFSHGCILCLINNSVYTRSFKTGNYWPTSITVGMTKQRFRHVSTEANAMRNTKEIVE